MKHSEDKLLEQAALGMFQLPTCLLDPTTSHIKENIVNNDILKYWFVLKKKMWNPPTQQTMSSVVTCSLVNII